MYKSCVARHRFVEAGGNAPAAFERVEAALNEVALAVEELVETSLFLPLGPGRDDRFDVSVFHCLEYGVGIVRRVGKTNRPRYVVEKLYRDCGLMPLAWRELNVQWSASKVGDQVDLGRKTASGTAYSVFFGPPRPPLAS